MHQFTTFFKWTIGDVVTHKLAPAIENAPPYPFKGTKEERREWRYTWGGVAREAPLMIMGRLAEECPGGVQRFYLCRGTDSVGGITAHLVRLHEEELRDLTPPAPADEEAEEEAPAPPDAPAAAAG